jgi:hypothetical protein
MGEAAEIIAILSAEAQLVRWIDFIKKRQFERKYPKKTLTPPKTMIQSNKDTIIQ